MAKIDVTSVALSASNYKDHQRFWDENKIRLLKQIESKIPRNVNVDGGKNVRIEVVVESNDAILTMNTNESYKIVTVDKDDTINVKIESYSIYGARHGLETVSQFVVFDDIRKELQVRLEVICEAVAQIKIIFRSLRNSILLTNPLLNIVDFF